MTKRADRASEKCLGDLRLLAFLRRRGGLLATVLIGLTGLILTVLSQLPETTQLSYVVTRVTMLTEQPEAKGLVGEYYFEDMRIELLWQLHVNLINTGNQTLIGQGQIANVLGSGLTAEVPEQYRILRADVYRNDAAVSVAPDGDRELVLSFAQWRSGEAVELVLYVEAALITMAAEPELTFAGRQLVDGRVVRGPTRGDGQLRRATLLDRIGGVSAAAVRVLGSVILGLLAAVSGIVLFLFCKDYFTASRAAGEIAEYSEAVSKWLSEHPELGKDTQERLQAASGRLGRIILAELITSDPAVTPDLIGSFPRLPNEPTFSTHRSRTVGVLIAAILCALFILLAIDLAFGV